MGPQASQPQTASGPAPDGDGDATARPAARTPIRIPPRFWWLKRLAVAGVAYVLLLVGVRLWWGYEADRRLQAEVDAIRSRGEPLFFQDYDLTAPADEDAGPLIQQAVAALPPGMSADEPSDLADLLKRGVECDDVARQFLAKTASARQLLRAAAQRPRAAWGLQLNSPLNWTNLRWPLEARQLGKVAATAALAEYAAGDDAAALATVRDALILARHMCDNSPFLVTHSVAVACDSLATSTLARMLANVEVDDAPPQSLLRRRVARVPATRGQLLELRDWLLDEATLQRALRAACCGERTLVWDEIGLALAGVRVGPLAMTVRSSVEAALGRVAFDPAVRLRGARCLADMGWLVAASAAEDWMEVRLPTVVLPPEGSLRGLTLFPWESEGLLWSSNLPLRGHFGLIGERRLTATAIAIRLYELDHGRRPETLDALVPEYLAAVPRDPFRGGGGPIGYLRDDEAPRLYCAGINGIDENGLLVWSSPTRLDFENSDYPVVFLDGRAPWEPASPFAEQRVLKIGPPAPGEERQGDAGGADTVTQDALGE